MILPSKNTDTFRLFPGIWIVLGVGLLLGARFVWCWTHYPHQIEQLARELSAINVVQKPPVVNHAGTLAAAIHTTAQGVGVFIIDTKTGKERNLFEVKDVDYLPDDAWSFGWSNDDKHFAFSFKKNLDTPATLYFLDGEGEGIDSQLDSTNGVQTFVWLSSTACAYIDRDPRLNLIVFTNGQWRPSTSWMLPTEYTITKSLCAIGNNNMAWQSTNCIWTLNTLSGAINRIYSSSPRSIDSLSYSPDKNEFLLVENTNRTSNSSLVALALGSDGAAVSKEIAHDAHVTDVQWINHGDGYATVTARGDRVVLSVRKDEQSPPTAHFTGGHVWNLCGNDMEGSLYLLAAQGSEPPGIWRFKVAEDKSDCVVSPWGENKVEFHFQPALTGAAKYAQGGRTHYARFDLVPPANFSRGEKYPLVIGTASYEWTPIAHGIYAQCLANCGAYVVLVNYSWDQSRAETIEQVTNNVLAAYNQMSANPNIDVGRVYLFGFSAGTTVLSKLLKEYPGRWRGIMLLNPSEMPQPVAGMTDRILATAGSGEGEEKRFHRYQEGMLKMGITMDWYIHADTQHVVRDKNAMYERTILMGRMIFEE